MRHFKFPHLFNSRKLVLALACTLACGSAFAQWQWVDSTGRKVFSDTAPPQSIPDKNILKRPKGSAPLASPSAQPPATPVAAPAAVPKPAGVDAKLEAKRKEAEQEQELKRKEAEEKMMAARADNCTRSKNAKATMQMGTRIQTVNAKGERIFLDDNARAAESKRLDGIIASDCGPLPSQASSEAPSSGRTAVP
ncbi:MAG: DUF4124 domain-containing protein [Hydrogenophaga sp.]